MLFCDFCFLLSNFLCTQHLLCLNPMLKMKRLTLPGSDCSRLSQLLLTRILTKNPLVNAGIDIKRTEG